MYVKNITNTTLKIKIIELSLIRVCKSIKNTTWSTRDINVGKVNCECLIMKASAEKGYLRRNNFFKLIVMNIYINNFYAIESKYFLQI